MPSEETRRLLKLFGIAVTDLEVAVAKGAAKGDPSDQIAKMGAREVADGAIIFRSGDKLYIVDGKPPDSAPTSPSIISWLKERPLRTSRARPSRA